MFNLLLGIISSKAFFKYINIILLGILCPLIIYIAWKKDKILVSKNSIVIIGFAFFYYVISMLYEIDVSRDSIACVLSYYIGMMLVEISKNKEKSVITYSYSIAIGFFIHAMANYIINIGTQDRNTIDIWTGVQRSATLQATMLTILVGSSFYSLFALKNKLHKLIITIFIILSLSYNLILGTRTLIIVFAVSSILSCITFIILNRRNRALVLKNVKTLLIVIIVIFLVFISDFMGIREKIEDTKLLRRINKTYSTEEADENRVQTLFLAFDSILEHPMGGNNERIGELKYAHNMWLDVGKQAGIIPFLLLILFTIISLWNVIKIFKNNRFSTEFKVFLVGIYSAVLLNMTVEPILQGEPLFFIMFCMIIGMVDNILL